VHERPRHIQSTQAKNAVITPIFVPHLSCSATHFSDCSTLVCRGWFPSWSRRDTAGDGKLATS